MSSVGWVAIAVAAAVLILWGIKIFMQMRGAGR